MLFDVLLQLAQHACRGDIALCGASRQLHDDGLHDGDAPHLAAFHDLDLSIEHVRDQRPRLPLSGLGRPLGLPDTPFLNLVETGGLLKPTL